AASRRASLGTGSVTVAARRGDRYRESAEQVFVRCVRSRNDSRGTGKNNTNGKSTKGSGPSSGPKHYLSSTIFNIVSIEPVESSVPPSDRLRIWVITPTPDSRDTVIGSRPHQIAFGLRLRARGYLKFPRTEPVLCKIELRTDCGGRRWEDRLPHARSRGKRRSAFPRSIAFQSLDENPVYA